MGNDEVVYTTSSISLFQHINPVPEIYVLLAASQSKTLFRNRT